MQSVSSRVVSWNLLPWSVLSLFPHFDHAVFLPEMYWPIQCLTHALWRSIIASWMYYCILEYVSLKACSAITLSLCVVSSGWGLHLLHLVYFILSLTYPLVLLPKAKLGNLQFGEPTSRTSMDLLGLQKPCVTSNFLGQNGLTSRFLTFIPSISIPMLLSNSGLNACWLCLLCCVLRHF